MSAPHPSRKWDKKISSNIGHDEQPQMLSSNRLTVTVKKRTGDFFGEVYLYAEYVR